MFTKCQKNRGVNMNYTDKDVQAIVDTQVELKTKELKQALIDIREYIKNTTTMIVVGKPMKLSEETSGKDILQIIDKYLGGSDERDNTKFKS